MRFEWGWFLKSTTVTIANFNVEVEYKMTIDFRFEIFYASDNFRLL